MSNAAYGTAYQRYSADIRFVITASLAKQGFMYHAFSESGCGESFHFVTRTSAEALTSASLSHASLAKQGFSIMLFLRVDAEEKNKGGSVVLSPFIDGVEPKFF